VKKPHQVHRNGGKKAASPQVSKTHKKLSADTEAKLLKHYEEHPQMAEMVCDDSPLKTDADFDAYVFKVVADLDNPCREIILRIWKQKVEALKRLMGFVELDTDLCEMAEGLDANGSMQLRAACNLLKMVAGHLDGLGRKRMAKCLTDWVQRQTGILDSDSTVKLVTWPLNEGSARN
jgi:uncharacterized protein (DUF2236 family)